MCRMKVQVNIAANMSAACCWSHYVNYCAPCVDKENRSAACDTYHGKHPSHTVPHLKASSHLQHRSGARLSTQSHTQAAKDQLQPGGCLLRPHTVRVPGGVAVSDRMSNHRQYGMQAQPMTGAKHFDSRWCPNQPGHRRLGTRGP